MYTDDKNAQVVLSLLKKFNIKKIVASPGTTNVPISRTVQNDPYFEVYSVVDERSAAYFATGLSFASNEPVVISCTGATASRNYLSALTEAYYRNLPIIALTSQHHSPDYNDLVPQLTDRTVSQNDIKRYAALLPVVKDDEDLKQCIFQVNKALSIATTNGRGPVHINLPVNTSYTFKTKKLPDYQKIDYYSAETITEGKLGHELLGKKIGIFIGAHNPFDDATLKSINKFVKKTGAVVFYDHTSNYTGENRVLTSQIADLLETSNVPDLVIDIGSISGDYSASRLFRGVPTWRISEDGELHNRQGIVKLRKVFHCTERYFFESINATTTSLKLVNYYNQIAKSIQTIKVPNLPLSNTFISYRLSSHLPKGSLLHMGILNSLRNMDFFEVDKSIMTSCNVGGFGIDGPVSTLIGQSVADRNRLAFGLVGDLAFFYDMNALGIRDVGKNIRILLVNNGNGVEFRLNVTLEGQWGSDTDKFISAAGHNGSAQAWAESRGFKYMSAKTKKEFDEQLGEFCHKDVDYFGAPVLFEVFTEVADEQQAIKHIRDINRPVKKSSVAEQHNLTPKKVLKKVAPKKAVGAYRKLKNGGK